MPWKEPGEKPREPRGREPWGPRPGGSGGGPDFTAWLKKLQRSLGPFGRGPLSGIALLVLIIVLWFLIGGWVSIGDGQVGVLLRFGRFQQILQPGLHLRLPSPIDRVDEVDMSRSRTVSDEARLLTRDGQLVLVDYDAHYKVTNARDFLFSTRDVGDLVRAEATAAVRAAVGSQTLECLISDLGAPCKGGRVDRDTLAGTIRQQMDAELARLQGGFGIAMTSVDVSSIGVPADVRPAFDAITKAHDDAQTAKAGAKADVARNKTETQAKVASIKADAAKYRRQTLADAKASVARFDKLLTQYQASPQVLRHRLWLDAMQAVLSRNRVVVNTGSGSVIVQFPLQHPHGAGAPASAASSAPVSGASAPAPASAASTTIPVTSGPRMQALRP